MTDQEIINAIKASPALQSLANAGYDDALAKAIDATLHKGTPITTGALSQASPHTLAAIASGTNPLSEMEVIASRVRAGDSQGVGSWASTLNMLGKMPDSELAVVNALIAGTVGDAVEHTQVSATLAPLRHNDDGTIRVIAINWSAVGRIGCRCRRLSDWCRWQRDRKCWWKCRWLGGFTHDEQRQDRLFTRGVRFASPAKRNGSLPVFVRCRSI